MKKLVFAMVAIGLSTSLFAGTWVKGKLSMVQQWENNSYFILTTTAPSSGSAKFTISSVLNAEGQKKLLSMMLTARAMDADIEVYTPTNAGDIDFTGHTLHLMKSVKID